MLSEIGSNFWINPNVALKDKPLGSPEQFGCKGNDFVWLSTGRSAIGFAIKSIEEKKPNLKKTAVLPPFTCHTVIEPFLKAGFKVYYYSIDEKMMASADAILKCAEEYEASIILFHNYFGFNTLSNVDKLCEALRKQNRYSIEDCTQCLYSGHPKSSADFYVGSIRKWHGTPDGGFVVCRNHLLKEKPILRDEKLDDAKVKASYAKYKFLFEKEGDKPTFLQLYREAEDLLESQETYHTISLTSQKLQSNLDVSFLCEKRRTNYQVLLSGLLGLQDVRPMCEVLDSDAVPLYFPLLVKDRSALQAHLVANDIYAPVVWPKADCLDRVCEEAEILYEHLLCIPIDQRYDADDMNRIISVIKSKIN